MIKSEEFKSPLKIANMEFAVLLKKSKKSYFLLEEKVPKADEVEKVPEGRMR